MGKIDDVLARIAGQRVYLDTNIFIYFLDRHPIHFDPVAALLRASINQAFFAATGDVAVAEVMVGPYRYDDPALAAQFKRFFAQRKLLTVVAHEREVFDNAAMLVAKNRMKFVDALHVATAINTGCHFFITNDAGIASVEGLEVILLSEFGV